MAEIIKTVGTLAGICGEDAAGDWQRLQVDASERLKVLVDAITAALEVTQDTPADLLTGAHGWTGAVWRKIAVTDAGRLREESGAGTLSGYTHTHPNVGVATAEVLALNANRIYLLLENDSDTDIYVKFGADAVLNQGIRLNAHGGSYEAGPKFGNNITSEIDAIHGGAGNKVLLIVEGT